jgi:LPS export ABC transporter protein LptC
MKTRRAWLLLTLLVVAAAAFWVGRDESGGPGAEGGSDAAQVAYDYEAHDVVLRQMGPDGRLLYQVEARQITQLPDSGRITAQGLTLLHDPAGTEPGGPNRWTLTAERGELPAEGGVISLAGDVRAQGVPVGGRARVTFLTPQLQYDLDTQELSSSEEVQLTWGGNSMKARGLSFNIGTSEVTGSDVNATLAPR